MTTTATAQVIQVPDKFTRVWHSKKPYQIWYGGRYSAKSWTKAVYFLSKLMTAPYCRTVFARDTQKNVRNSQYQLFKDIAKRFEVFSGEFDFTDGPMKILSRRTENYAMGGSFEMPDSLRSVADPTDFWAEEPITRGNEISKQDFFDIVGSLRNAEGIQTQFHFTFNPISKATWIYKDFFELDLYDCEKLFVNYWDNPFCPQSGLDFLNSLKVLDPKRYKVDALGEWGTAYEGLIYPNVESVELFPGRPAFYGLDLGFTDPCALIEGRVLDMMGQPKKDLVVNELLYETGHTSKTLIQRFINLGISKDVRMICDSARPEMILDLKRAGYRAEPCFKKAGSVLEGIVEVQKYNLKFTRTSRNLFDEASTYCWDMKNEKLLDKPALSIDHGMDAIRYGVETQRKQPAVFYSA